MHRLLEFLYRYRVLSLFIVLEGICFWMIVTSNSYQRAAYFTTTSNISSYFLEKHDGISGYFNLTETNTILAEENARLKQILLAYTDTIPALGSAYDSIPKPITAKVVDNSLHFRNNYITINKGRLDGIEVGMGVVGPDGIIGQVHRTSAHYATLISLLHSRSMISSMHLPSRAVGTVSWSGNDPRIADLKFIPRHIAMQVGDSIVTSGYNSIYPTGNLIGVLEEVDMKENGAFYNATVKLSTDFNRLSFVYVMNLVGKDEIDSLAQTIEEIRKNEK